VASRRQITVGGVTVGGGAPVRVQSMTCTPTADADATLAQIRSLHEAGCEIARVSVPAAEDVEPFGRIVAGSPVPVIADIHYDWRLALGALDAGAAGVRINPGTIGRRECVDRIVESAAAHGAVLRVGINQGSLPRALRGLAADDPARALVEAAQQYTTDLDELGFFDYKDSVKSSNVPVTIAAYRMLAETCDAPLHVGVTEAGTRWSGTIKSAAGIGALLAACIGDTIRVSLTADPVEEVRVAWALLSALGLRQRGPDLISCPTCARTEIDIVSLAEEVERRLQTDPRFARLPITVAVMGCRVNGPEEARHADAGIAGGRGEGVVFVRGKRVATVPEERLVDELFERLAGMAVDGTGPAGAASPDA